jgi:hypothetical protein
VSSLTIASLGTRSKTFKETKILYQPVECVVDVGLSHAASCMNTTCVSYHAVTLICLDEVIICSMILYMRLKFLMSSGELTISC